MIQLTEQQRQVLRKGEALHLSLPEIGEDVVVLRASKFEKMCEMLENHGESDTLVAGQLEASAEYQAALAKARNKPR